MTNNNPWKGLESYKYSDAGQFYGRDQELCDLAEIIRQNSFTTIYGISGAGKTSIINAGLCPLLDKEHFLPVYIRLNHGKDRISYDQQIINATENALIKIGGEAEKSHDVDVESEFDQLWLYFHSHTFWTKDNHKIAPVLFIDQFEEIFTKNDDVNDIWSFFNIIDSLQYNMPTERILNLIQANGKSITFGEEANFRVVFSMREDFLPRLEDYCFDIPAMRRNRVGLKSLNGLQAIEVITKPCPGVVTREVALHIISKVVGKKIADNTKRLKGTLVDTSILSLFCTELYNYRDKSKGEGIITTELVDLYGGNILEWFYDRNMQILPKNTYIYLENHLLTHNGFRNSIAVDDLLENNVTQEQIDKLEENRIIRVEDINHNLRVEFTHDVLCKIAKKRKDERDSISKAKDEATATRLFTFDTVIFALAIIYPIVNVFYVGPNEGLLGSLSFLPFICILYLIFIHRTLSDKNFSIVLGSIFACVALSGLFGCVGDAIHENYTTKSIRNFGFSLICVVPFLFLISPLIYNIYSVIEDKLINWVRKCCFIIACFVLSILYLLFVINEKPSYYDEWVLVSIPLIIFLLTPFAILIISKKRQAIKPINVFASIYAGYAIILFSAVFLSAKGYIDLYTRSNVSRSRSWEYYWIAEWMVFAVMAVLYLIAYLRQPKEIAFRKYLDNIMEVQSFRKYNSFSTRFVTIFILLFILLAGIAATTYIDVIPFVTLPVIVLLSLHIISTEIKFTVKKKVFSTSVLLPVLLVSECLLALQYFIFPMKYIVILLASLVSSVAITYFYCHTENVKSNKWLAARIWFYSILISALLPSVSVGYNMLNPRISDVYRVWDGRIPSNQNRLYFMTIADKKGNKGVMDYSDIIIRPMYASINYAHLSSEAFSIVYPVAYTIQESIGITSDLNYSGSMRDCFFSCKSDDKHIAKHNYSAFFTSKNKFGSIFSIKEIDTFCSKELIEDNSNDYDTTECDTIVCDSVDCDTEVSAYSHRYTPSESKELYNADVKTYNGIYNANWLTRARFVLSQQNMNINANERRKAIARIFINALFEYGVKNNVATEYDRWDYVYSAINSDSLTLLFIESYDNASFDRILSYKGKMITSNQIEHVMRLLYPLLASDTTNYTRDFVYGKLRKKFASSWANSDFAYYLLFSKDTKMAKDYLLANKDRFLSSNKRSYYLNLCTVSYCEGDLDAFKRYLKKGTELLKEDIGARRMFLKSLVGRVCDLNDWGVKLADPDYLYEAYTIASQYKWPFGMDSSNPDKDFILKEESERINLLAYEFAKEKRYQEAMATIDFAIKLRPEYANYYDSRGEFLLLQGKKQDALIMWKKVTELNPYFLDAYPNGTKLSNGLKKLKLISKL